MTSRGATFDDMLSSDGAKHRAMGAPVRGTKGKASPRRICELASG